MANRPPQQVVRAGQFDRALQNFSLEMGAKTAQAMAKFHGMYIAPLERRILLIETILGIRLVRWIRFTLYRGWRWVRGKVLAGWHHFYMWATKAIPEELRETQDSDETQDSPLEEPSPEPEHDGNSRILSLSD